MEIGWRKIYIYMNGSSFNIDDEIENVLNVP